MDDLVLLSCSRDKRDDGGLWPDQAAKFTAAFLSANGMKLATIRHWIFDRLRCERSWLYNGDHKGEFCHERWSNSRLRLGPDFGGNDGSGA